MKRGFKILVVDDEPEFLEAYSILLSEKGYEVICESQPRKALCLLEKEYFPLVMVDLVMPGMDGMEFLKNVKALYGSRTEVIIVTGFGTIENAVRAVKLGAFGYFIKSSDPESMLAEVEKVRKMFELKAENSMLKYGLLEEDVFLSTKNPKMMEVLEMIERVSRTDSNVLLLGESGTGKEVIAKLIHKKSSRSIMPFVAINCKAYPLSLLESELFGHEKGAFTGATSKRQGKLEEAGGGTLFLDEIGEIEADVQVKLLRVLETRTVERLGSNKPVSVDFRLICATNNDIDRAIEQGTFRPDLYYRISTIVIRIPPLRERKEDIPGFIEFFMNSYSRIMGKYPEMEEGAVRLLAAYDYPGNIRELKNIIERLFVLCDGIITEEDVKRSLQGAQKSPGRGGEAPAPVAYETAKEDFERRYFSMLFELSGGNLSQVSRLSGLSRRQVFNKIKKYSIK
ncbi:sigma-54-dependent transcriptional regulator [Thermosediminibacter litoriperuensis]|uniref:Stage 0 sporulation protein A homolog n=1 Tax=Thermosediminibacter litoriperuensis TaxID=291989 RepID=A0A5S5AR52_9FIRM|nr:sigma-54 dependent transcriptional regulator [Thermosediminibacter litoriperuensis]TYP53790.1 DNA-binding NtrC family response regulator [Thermosediminibacter litoriperuensis]